jgi:hypothetical protein
MDCGWQNPEWVANDHYECPKSLASNEDCIERAAPPQTSGMRDVLSLSARMISLQTNLQPSRHRCANYIALCAFFIVRAALARFRHSTLPNFKLRHYRDFFSVARQSGHDPQYSQKT